MNIEIMRNTLYKAYLDDFSAFCNKLGGTTAEVMGNLLSFEVPPPLLGDGVRSGIVLPASPGGLDRWLLRSRAQQSCASPKSARLRVLRGPNREGGMHQPGSVLN